MAGAAWAVPTLFSGTAWAHVGDHGTQATACACGDGIVVYAKFAPGNSQTCQNQCLQPGPEVIRFPFQCLVDNGIVSICDDVNSNDDYASLNFFKGTRPLRVAIKSENDCFIARCNEGFHQIYKWSSSFNCEDFPEDPCGTTFDPSHNNTDPSTDPELGIFRVYTDGGGTPGPCKGNVDASGHLVPNGVQAGGSAQGDHPFYGAATGISLSTENISPNGNDKLNFIEMELCIPNASKLPCSQNLCKD